MNYKYMNFILVLVLRHCFTAVDWVWKFWASVSSSAKRVNEFVLLTSQGYFIALIKQWGPGTLMQDISSDFWGKGISLGHVPHLAWTCNDSEDLFTAKCSASLISSMRDVADLIGELKGLLWAGHSLLFPLSSNILKKFIQVGQSAHCLKEAHVSWKSNFQVRSPGWAVT